VIAERDEIVARGAVIVNKRGSDEHLRAEQGVFATKANLRVHHCLFASEFFSVRTSITHSLA